MKVTLLHNSPLSIPDMAIGKCWDKQKCEPDLERMYRVANKHKHKSTIEHLVYSFDIDGVSRALLQELARHRIASYSVKSTRYTLKELKEEEEFTVYGDYTDDSFLRAYKYVVFTDNDDVDDEILRALERLRLVVSKGIANDITKYCLPEAYKTSLVMTINARALQNFIELRTSKSALWEIRNLAKAMYDVLPEEHKFLFKEYVND